MLKSGITVDESLSALAEQTDSKYFELAINRVLDDINKGSLLSAAFAKEVKVFDAVFVSLIKAGEESGTLRENLEFVSKWLEHAAELRREVRGAILYPKLVFIASILLGGGLAVFVLPRLIPLFGQLDVELPLITVLLMNITLFLQSYWLWCGVGLILILFLYKLSQRFYLVRYGLHYLEIKLPFIGPILKAYQLALITQLFATLLHSGITLNQAIDIVEEATPNLYYRQSMTDLRESLYSGRVLSEAMKRHLQLYPSLFVNIVSVGEQSGTLSDSFVYLSDYYNKEVRAKAKQLPTIMEPLLLIFIAMVVGLIALAIILPIYKLTGSIN